MTVELAPLPGATDWRRPEHRRGVWQDFMEFHTRHGIHPGCVYFLIPWLAERYEWDAEQTLWFAFINGNTQHPVTSLLLHRRGDRPDRAHDVMVWFDANRARLAWDTDRRYHRPAFGDAMAGYLAMLAGRPQRDFWMAAADRGWPTTWRAATAIPTFARLSAWSFCDYLHCAGIPIDCDDLMLRDWQGSRSHRNGLCIVAGLDRYDWHPSNEGFNGRYPLDVVGRLETLGQSLLREARDRAAGQPWERDVNYLTVESALCTYKGWHRPDRRYPGVYADMLHDRIAAAEQRFDDADLDVFWEARAARLPAWLRLEDTPGDPGVASVKQNHYRLTGEVVVMGRDQPKYWSAFDAAVENGVL